MLKINSKIYKRLKMAVLVVLLIGIGAGGSQIMPHIIKPQVKIDAVQSVGLTTSSIQSLLLSDDQSTAFAAGTKAVYRSTDKGNSWQDITSGISIQPQNQPIDSVTKIAVNDGRLWLLANGIMFLSSDSGNIWRQISSTSGSYGTDILDFSVDSATLAVKNIAYGSEPNTNETVSLLSAGYLEDPQQDALKLWEKKFDIGAPVKEPDCQTTGITVQHSCPKFSLVASNNIYYLSNGTDSSGNMSPENINLYELNRDLNSTKTYWKQIKSPAGKSHIPNTINIINPDPYQILALGGKDARQMEALNADGTWQVLGPAQCIDTYIRASKNSFCIGSDKNGKHYLQPIGSKEKLYITGIPDEAWNHISSLISMFDDSSKTTANVLLATDGFGIFRLPSTATE